MKVYNVWLGFGSLASDYLLAAGNRESLLSASAEAGVVLQTRRRRSETFDATVG